MGAKPVGLVEEQEGADAAVAAVACMELRKPNSGRRHAPAAAMGPVNHAVGRLVDALVLLA